MKDMKQTESPDATPEQLMQMLDLQLAVQRSHREQSGRNRATILVGGVLFIIVAAGVALLVLDQMLMDIKPDKAPAPSGQLPANGK
ncbi:MAG: hypothetical protein ACAI37_12285 [Chthoniobacter sp.]